MKFGLLLPMFGELVDVGLLREVAQLAEDTGFESLWMGDHLVLPEQSQSTYEYLKSKSYSSERGKDARTDRWEALSALTYLAGITDRVVLGTSVLIAPYRHPIAAAKVLSTLDVLCDGRLEIGVGAGWLEEEFDALGAAFADRGSLTDEIIQIWEQAWSGDTVEHDGRHFSVHGVSMTPRPVRGAVDLAIGGHSRATRRRIVQYGAGWHAVTESPDHCYGWGSSFRETLDLLREDWHAAHGDGSGPPVSGVVIEGPAASVEGIVASVPGYEDLGLERLILDFPAARCADAGHLMTTLERLARELPLEQRSAVS